MTSAANLLPRMFMHPEQMAALTLTDWDLLVRQARSANLLARLCVLLADHGLLQAVPQRPRNHLESSLLLTEKHARDILWEVRCIREAMAARDIPFVLLKGAAYVLAGLPPARGRLFSDVDIMVPKTSLNEAEKALMMKGWVTTHPDAYDQRYYRQWMHELPPLQHIKRRAVLDVHHTILPETARLKPNAALLLESAVPLDGDDFVKVLSPVDMVLHSATHLFHDGELDHGLRDLVDLNDLLRHFSARQGFWEALVDRALTLDLGRPLFYALRYTHRILATPVPAQILEKSAAGSPGILMMPVIDALFTRGLAAPHSSCKRPFSGLARWLLYIRSHYLRMPMHLLIPHLVRKSFRARFEKGPAKEEG